MKRGECVSYIEAIHLWIKSIWQRFLFLLIQLKQSPRGVFHLLGMYHPSSSSSLKNFSTSLSRSRYHVKEDYGAYILI